MGSKRPPPAPDYRGAAEQQAQASREATTAQTWANRPDVVTPWGRQTWQSNETVDPATGQRVTRWTQNVELSPEQQQALDSQMAIQQGRSNAAQTLLGQATNAFQTPMDWDGLPAGGDRIQARTLGDLSGVDPNTQNSAFSFGNIQSQIGPTGALATRLAPTSRGQSFASGPDGGINLSGPNQANPFGFGASGGQIQTRLNSDPTQIRQQAQQAVFDLQKPMLDQERADLESQLANQGLARGSEAWNREMTRMDDRVTRAQLTAIEAGRGEAAQMFGQDLASGQFANQAQAQGFGQNVTNVNLNNQAIKDQFGLDLSSMNFENDAQAQQFMQGLQAIQQNNQAQAQEFQQALASGQFGNDAQIQAFQQALASGQFANQAQNQQFQQSMGSAEFANRANQQNFSNVLSLADRNDVRAMREQQMALQAGEFNNSIRAQRLAEMLQRRNQPLNELNALLTGQQVGMPQMPQFSQAGRSETPDYLSAMNMGYNAQLDGYNARMGMLNNLMNMGGQAATSYFMFSDRRLKTDVRKVGKLPSGISLFEFRYKNDGRKFLGVIAQEVRKIIPSAVKRDIATGYFMVDMAKVA